MRFLSVSNRLLPLIMVFLAMTGMVACGETALRTPASMVLEKDEEFTVLPLQTMTVVVQMEEKKRLKGSISVSGGNNDIKVYVKDDFGNSVVEPVTIVEGYDFEYVPENAGFYTIYFDNSFSVTVNKQVKLHYEVR
jgi:hypothetical protein